MAENIAKFKVTADASQFASEMAKARESAEKAFGDIKASAGGLKTLLGATFVGFSVAGFTASIKSAIDSLDGLYDLSLRTGASVESLSAFRSVAKLSGTDMELLGTSIQKLSRAMVGADEEGQKSAGTFQRLGVAVKDGTGNLRPAEDVLVDVAKALTGLESGTQRVALAQQIFGKSGAQLLPFLQELATTGKLNAKVTTEQAEAADKFNDNLLKITTSGNALKISMANAVLPTLNNITDAFIRGTSEGGKFTGMIRAIQTAITGTDRQKADKELVDLTDNILAQERAVRDAELSVFNARKRLAAAGQEDTPFGKEQIAQAQRIVTIRKQELQQLQARTREVTTFRDQLSEEEAAATKKPPNTVLGDDTAKAVKDAKISVEELFARMAQARLKAADETAAAFDKAGEQEAEATEKLLTASASAVQKQRQQEADAADALITKLQQMKQQYIDLIDPADQYRRKLVEVDVLEKEGLITAEQAIELRERLSKAAQDATLNVAEYGKAAKEADDIGRQLGLTFTSVFEDAVIEGKKAGEVIKSLGKDIARLILRQQITEPLAKAGTSFFGDIFKGFNLKGLLGFASGGSFTVGGGGGTDSQVVAFRATPGEQVTVKTPAQQAAGGGGMVQVVLNISTGVSATVRQEIAQLIPQIQQAATAGVIDARRRGTRGLA